MRKSVLFGHFSVLCLLAPGDTIPKPEKQENLSSRSPQSTHHPHKRHDEHRLCNPGVGVVVFPYRPGKLVGRKSPEMGKNYKVPLPGLSHDFRGKSPPKRGRITPKIQFCNFSVLFH